MWVSDGLKNFRVNERQALTGECLAHRGVGNGLGNLSAVNPSDLLAINQIRRHWRGEAFCPLYKPHYKWYYLRNQRVDEVIFLKDFDSQDVPAKCELHPYRIVQYLIVLTVAPHSSFRPADIPQDAPKWSSIVVRAMVSTFSN